MENPSGGWTRIDRKIGERVQNRRRKKDITQAELSRKAHIGINVLSRLEHGRQTIAAERLRDIALALCTSADYLLGISDDE